MLKKKMEGEGKSNKQGTKRSEEGERLAEDGEEDVEVHRKDRQVAEPEEKTNMMVMIKMMRIMVMLLMMLMMPCLRKRLVQASKMAQAERWMCSWEIITG